MRHEGVRPKRCQGVSLRGGDVGIANGEWALNMARYLVSGRVVGLLHTRPLYDSRRGGEGDVDVEVGGNEIGLFKKKSWMEA